MTDKNFPDADVKVYEDGPEPKVGIRISGTRYHMPLDEAEAIACKIMDAVDYARARPPLRAELGEDTP